MPGTLSRLVQQATIGLVAFCVAYVLVCPMTPTPIAVHGVKNCLGLKYQVSAAPVVLAPVHCIQPALLHYSTTPTELVSPSFSGTEVLITACVRRC
jgi:hypothetical protein